MTDADRAPDPELIARALPPGAAIVLRDYAAPNRDALARRLAVIARARDLVFLVGADMRLACQVKADGVHLPSWAPLPDALKSAANGKIVTCACHNGDELARAAEINADAAFLSPALETASHAGAGGLGADAFKERAGAATLPVLALGGVDEHNARLLAGPNVAGLAAISAFLAR